MKKILGLDLGVGSCGWSLIQVTDDYQPTDILGLGSRVIPLSTNDSDEFSKGKAISKNANRTAKRTQRRGYDRYQQRRLTLRKKLNHLGMLPDDSLVGLDILLLWNLRANAATPGHKISLKELGRVLLHLNQKRGYKHAKTDASADSKQTEYVKTVNQRFSDIQELNMTIGQYLAFKIKESEITLENGKKAYTYRTKDQVYPRAAYEAEFRQIMNCQKDFYPDILTDEIIEDIYQTIYWQRPLKSCKHLVALCESEKREYKNKKGEKVFDGPKVAPRTSPLFQVCRIWEAVNNIVVKNRHKIIKSNSKQLILPLDAAEHYGNSYELSNDERLIIFNHLNTNEKLTGKELLKMLNLSKDDGWYVDKAVGKGIKGNDTFFKLSKALDGYPLKDELLQFELKLKDTDIVDSETGEILQEISNEMMSQPLYKLWHTIYSINEKDELCNALRKNFGIHDEEILNRLYNIDFVTPGFGNKSSKFMRKILPYLQEGMRYKTACEYIENITKKGNENRELLDRLPNIKKNELRQPIVEKILNQMINIVNAVKDKYGNIDEIRIELARELKQSKDERKETTDRMSKHEKQNKLLSERIANDYNFNRVSRNKIQKLKLWEESEKICMYCGQPVNVAEFLSGYNAEVEHIIPRSLFFDDSFSNKVCSCRRCNQEKGNRTAFDFMKSRGDVEFEKYHIRVNNLYEKKNGISKTKHTRLLTSQSQIPNKFIDRDLRLTQYIARKSCEILRQTCKNVYATSGSVTDFFRHAWGYDNILADLNFERYKAAGLTEYVEIEHAGQKHLEEKIINWSKRMDHRHHAIDALTIALTRQGYIQRLNNLNTERDAMFAELNAQSEEFRLKHTLLQEWAATRPHFSTADVANAVAAIAVSFKAGKKVTTPGKRLKYKNGKHIVMQEGILVPRGALSEESVYGKIKIVDKKKNLKYIFANPDLIVDSMMRELVQNRLNEYLGDTKKAIASLKKRPLFWDRNHQYELKDADCFKNEIVLKYKLDSIKYKDIDSIVDKGVKEAVKLRFAECNNKDGEFVKSLAGNPLCLDKEGKMPIRSVRCFTGLSENKVAAVKWDETGLPIGYVKPGNNHHVALYMTPDGKVEEKVVTFWEAVQRKNFGLPVIVHNPNELWENIANLGTEIPEELLDKLPPVNSQFLISMQQNEMFVLGMSDDELQDAIAAKDQKAICEHLFRVQKLAERNYVFRRHIETSVDNDNAAKDTLKFYLVSSYGRLQELNPHKVKVTALGEIIGLWS